MEDRKPLAFSFSKTKEPEKIIKSNNLFNPSADDTKKKDDIDFVTSISDKQIVSSKPDLKKKGPLVIPVLPNGQAMSIEDKARMELIREAEEANGKSGRTGVTSSRIIPISLEKCAQSEQPSADDYEKVPVEEFGMAMLRGMGFKPEDAKVQAIEPKIRVKGLGLGAEKLSQ